MCFQGVERLPSHRVCLPPIVVIDGRSSLKPKSTDSKCNRRWILSFSSCVAVMHGDRVGRIVVDSPGAAIMRRRHEKLVGRHHSRKIHLSPELPVRINGWNIDLHDGGNRSGPAAAGQCCCQYNGRRDQCAPEKRKRARERHVTTFLRERFRRDHHSS